MLALFICAYLGAIVSTVPVGPINLSLIALSMRSKKACWYAAVLGVLIVDVFFAALAESLIQLDEASPVHIFPENGRMWGEGLLLLLIAFGIYLSKRPARGGVHKLLAKSRFEHRPFFWFVAGFLATVLEPGLPFFWISWWLAYGASLPSGLLATTVIILAVIVGDLTVFKIYEKIGAYLSRRVHAHGTLDPKVWSTRVLYAAFALIAADLIWQMLR
jgi:threonine/homoserine/homoserine lactone efflux protein